MIRFVEYPALPIRNREAAAVISATTQAEQIRRALYGNPQEDAGVKGWLCPEESAVQLSRIKQKAEEVRRDADVFVLVGVGGSNQAARAVIKSVRPQTKAPEVLYAGNTLSPYELADTLTALDGKSVYINVIAKNFETLEPGSHFRVLRRYMATRYSSEELSKRIILTGTRGSLLETISGQLGSTFLEFPVPIGGRYSAFTPVALFPMAVAGLDIDAYLAGAVDMYHILSEVPDNIAVQYAVARNLLHRSGYDIEQLAVFEPRLSWFAWWWRQLFGESEGKDGKGIFPSSAVYSEDLHSMGQYMQDGRRNLIETFLTADDPGAKLPVPNDPDLFDAFDYLNDKDFTEINCAAFEATLEAHRNGGVPCFEISIPQIDEYHFGQLYYFFMAACAISGKLLGVNPFDQEGVEEYKRSMFVKLGK